ncbi:TetR/AcrR family transcriptional regulator [Stackebrandtia nassauensis]|uniref:TetR/AcrR family transcriptional regulator n=1 Tax=Stackebrandtia nassauensis TaxID=283811 RepID=UPI0003016BA8|nr:TetR/AcrR family transcriptional regulator [Stackebrandtia nassauensis]
MGTSEPSRRQRLREQTTAEIKDTALSLMSSGGPDAITLRAIARRMGMTPNAIYGYFATRDDLITTLIDELYTSLVDAVETARDAHPADDPAGRIQAWGESFRSWSLANPEGFRLIYGDPVRDYQPPEGGAAPEAQHRACLGLVGLAVGAWPRVHDKDASSYRWSDFDKGLVGKVREAFPDQPPGVLALALRLWGRFQGLVSLEIYGHLRYQTARPAKLYRDELAATLRSLNLTPSGR